MFEVTGTESVEQSSAAYENLEVRSGGVLRVSRSGRVRSYNPTRRMALWRRLVSSEYLLSLMVDSDRDHVYAVYQGRSTIMDRYKGD